MHTFKTPEAGCAILADFDVHFFLDILFFHFVNFLTQSNVTWWKTTILFSAYRKQAASVHSTGSIFRTPQRNEEDVSHLIADDEELTQ